MRLLSAALGSSENRSGRLVSGATPFWVGPRQFAQSEPRLTAVTASATTSVTGRRRFMSRLSLLTGGRDAFGSARLPFVLGFRRVGWSPRAGNRRRFSHHPLRLHLKPRQRPRRDDLHLRPEQEL